MNRRHEEHLRHERRRKTITLAFSIFVVAAMVGGIFAGMLYNPATQDRLEYGEYEIFLKEITGGTVYALNLNGNDVELQHLPDLVTYLEVDPAVASLLQNAQGIALVADVNASPEELPTIDYARFQLALAFPNTFPGMNGENTYGQTVINCSMASPQMPVILFSSSNDTPQIVRQDACILVTGTGRGIMAAKDRLIYERLGIIVNGQVIED